MSRQKRKVSRLARYIPRLLWSAPLSRNGWSRPMIYCFGDYELDEHLYQLRRHGAPVAIEPKVFDVLTYLLQHRDRVVSKDELLDKLWPGQVVGESALTRCIRAARVAVGDDGSKQEIIETQHGRGYRFVAAVAAPVTSDEDRVLSQEEAVRSQPAVVSRQEPSTNGQPIGSVISVLVGRQDLPSKTPDSSPEMPLALPDKPSIIVLPFVNLSGDPEQEYFSDGMTEELTSSLSRIPSLFVIDRHSAFTYKGKAVKVQEVGKELGVRYVLQGSVQRTGQRVRINVQLVDASTGDHLWVERYDRDFTDIFTLQDEIVQKIVTTLKLQLILEEQVRIVRKRTNNPEAYDYFLRGMVAFDRLTREKDFQARELWEKAIALDPQYAEAYTALGWTYWGEWAWGWSQDSQTLDRALALARQALTLDNFLPQAHEVLSAVYAQQQQYDQAIAEGQQAIALDPNNADRYANQAEILSLARRPEEALKMLKQAMRLNPRYPTWYVVQVGLAYYVMSRYEEAIVALRESVLRTPEYPGAHVLLAHSYHEQWGFQLSRDPQVLNQAFAAVQRAIALSNASPRAHIALGMNYLLQKQYDDALSEMERVVTFAPALAESYTALAFVLNSMGKSEDALQAVDQALRLNPSVADTESFVVGRTYAFAGRLEEALPLLQRFVGQYPNMLGGHLELAYIYSELGKEAEAWAEAAEVLRINPKFSLEVHKERVPIKDPAVLERHIAALRKAGLK